MLSEFKKFIMRGNVLDLAIGVIIGAAFGKIVTSLVNDVLMPVIEFLIIAFVIFLIVKSVNKLQKPAPVAAPTTKPCPECTTEIPLAAKRCPACTSVLA